MLVKSCLIHHPDTSEAMVKSVHIGVKALFQNDNLRLQYDLSGAVASLLIPSAQPPEATTGLWEHTCFEAFVAVVDEAPYHEFNFSPSGQWAAYAFDDYRSPRSWQCDSPPAQSIVCTEDRLSLEVVIAQRDLPANPLCKTYRLGLTAVLESQDGQLSYWALCHPSGKPDFHHRTGFTLSLLNRL